MSRSAPVVVYDKLTGDAVGAFEHMTQAADFTGDSKSKVVNSAINRSMPHGWYAYRYVDDAAPTFDFEVEYSVAPVVVLIDGSLHAFSSFASAGRYFGKRATTMRSNFIGRGSVFHKGAWRLMLRLSKPLDKKVFGRFEVVRHG